MLSFTWNVGYYITKVVLHEYVVYWYDYSHLRGRLLEYKCELNVQYLHSQISQNMEQWMSYYKRVWLDLFWEISQLILDFQGQKPKISWLISQNKSSQTHFIIYLYFSLSLSKLRMLVKLVISIWYYRFSLTIYLYFCFPSLD